MRGDDDVASPCLELEGTVEKGPFIRGTSLSVSELDSALAPTGRVFNTETLTDRGDFSVDLDDAGLVSLEASGFFYNEVTGTLSAAPMTLRAYAPIDDVEVQTATVNLVTHLSYDRVASLVESGSSYASAREVAEEELRGELAIGLPDFMPGEVGTSMTLLGGDSDANAYLFAVGTVLTVAASRRQGPLDANLQEIVNTIGSDLGDDGALDVTLIANLLVAWSRAPRHSRGVSARKRTRAGGFARAARIVGSGWPELTRSRRARALISGARAGEEDVRSKKAVTILLDRFRG